MTEIAAGTSCQIVVILDDLVVLLRAEGGATEMRIVSTPSTWKAWTLLETR